MANEIKSNYARKEAWLKGHRWKQDTPSDQPELVKGPGRGPQRVWGFEVEDKPWKGRKK